MRDADRSQPTIDALDPADDQPLDLSGSDIETAIKGASISQVLTALLRQAVESKASDIHIEPEGKFTRVRYRVGGVLRGLFALPGYLHSALAARVKALAGLKHGETRLPQDGRLRLDLNGEEFDFRVSTLPVVGGEKVAVRVLGDRSGVPTLEGLGFRQEHRELLRSEMARPQGMILMVGPSGSGKTTTLMAMLGMMGDSEAGVSTLEDPVEHSLPGVRHSQIRPESGLTFAGGLRALMRQGPGVIMIGEMRDKETGELAAQAALTGHLMLASLPADGALEAVSCLADAGVEPFLLSSALNLLISQRLVRRICDHCKADADVPEAAARMAREILHGVPAGYLPDAPLIFKEGRGCVRCSDTGYSGRLAVAEILSVTNEMRKLIDAGLPSGEMASEAEAQGAITLRQDAMLKALEGLTTIDEALALAGE